MTKAEQTRLWGVPIQGLAPGGRGFTERGANVPAFWHVSPSLLPLETTV